MVMDGYVLNSDFEALDRARVEQALAGLAGAFALDLRPECDSTNTQLSAAPLPQDGRVPVLAVDRQTAGRGRRGRVWQSWPGASLTFSSLWQFAPGAPVPAGLSLVVGLALAQVLEQLGVAGVQLKWPNDVLIHGRKLAGVLVELSSGQRRGIAAVVGIGINLHLPPEADIPHEGGVIDLAACLDVPPGPNELLALILTRLHGLFGVYGAAGFGGLRAAWEERNAFAGLPVRIIDETREQRGNCAGVDEDGALLLDTPEGRVRVLSGEVSLRLA